MYFSTMCTKIHWVGVFSPINFSTSVLKSSKDDPYFRFLVRVSYCFSSGNSHRSEMEKATPPLTFHVSLVYVSIWCCPSCFPVDVEDGDRRDLDLYCQPLSLYTTRASHVWVQILIALLLTAFVHTQLYQYNTIEYNTIRYTTIQYNENNACIHM